MRNAYHISAGAMDMPDARELEDDISNLLYDAKSH